MKFSTRLAGIELDGIGPDGPEGTPTRLGTLWAERPVVLVFIRHFG